MASQITFSNNFLQKKLNWKGNMKVNCNPMSITVCPSFHSGNRSSSKQFQVTTSTLFLSMKMNVFIKKEERKVWGNDEVVSVLLFLHLQNAL